MIWLKFSSFKYKGNDLKKAIQEGIEEVAAGTQEALQQVFDKGYLQPYADSPKQRVAVGMNFSSEGRAMVAWESDVL